MALRGLMMLALAGVAIAFPSSAPASAHDAVIALPGDKLHPESVSILPDGTAYVGSMTGGVLRVDLRTGTAAPWIAPGTFGSGALFGVLADRRNNMLWTCTNSFPGTPVAVAGADTGAWFKGFDLATREGKVSVKLPGERPVCNDMAVGKDGSVYIADTGYPRILVWKPGTSELEVWVESPAFERAPAQGGLDGIAFGDDGNIYVNNVRSGAFYRVAMKRDGGAGPITELVLSRPLGNPDGMRPLGGTSFVVAEGVGRITRLTVKGDAVDVVTLAEGTLQSTGVDVHGGRAWYIQAYLGALFQRPNAPQPALPFHLTAVPLKP